MIFSNNGINNFKTESENHSTTDKKTHTTWHPISISKHKYVTPVELSENEEKTAITRWPEVGK